MNEYRQTHRNMEQVETMGWNGDIADHNGLGWRGVVSVPSTEGRDGKECGRLREKFEKCDMAIIILLVIGADF